MSTPASGTPGPAGPPGPSKPIPQRRETARRNIAYAAIGAFLLFLLIPLFFWAVGWIKLDDAVKMITTISSVLAGIVGAIVGFYFRAEEE